MAIQYHLPRPEHGMVSGQTWLIAVRFPSMEAGMDQRLLLVCLPPGIRVREGDFLELSEPGYLDRPPHAAGMPSDVVQVGPFPHLVLDPTVLESLAWGALSSGEAFVGEPYRGNPGPKKGSRR